MFPLAASSVGITPVWASEIEKAPLAITKKQFPDLHQLGDIRKIRGDQIEAVQVITFGSPCQNLSIIGDRTGLQGSKSGLFYEAIRIIKEMREKTDGIYPTFAVWENVMGALSTGNRIAFKAMLEAFQGAEIPMPPSGRWAGSGMVRGRQPDLSWRVLDAQYWGRPRLCQRRKRVFLVADFRGTRSAEILFKPRRMFPDFVFGADGESTAACGDRISAKEAGRELPIIRAFYGRKMRQAAKEQDARMFLQSFGKSAQPFPTLLANGPNPFAIWYAGREKEGGIRYPTPLECERMMGLPDGWTAYGAAGETISDNARYTALGNAIALPCAEYIMAGIQEVFSDE